MPVTIEEQNKPPELTFKRLKIPLDKSELLIVDDIPGNFSLQEVFRKKLSMAGRRTGRGDSELNGVIRAHRKSPDPS
jgi:hypothetical protein